MFNTSPTAVEVEKPKIIELTVQRKWCIIQEKINRGTQPIEFPQAQFWTRLVTVLSEGISELSKSGGSC